MTKKNWQEIYRTNFRHLPKLLDFLEIDTKKRKKIWFSPSLSLNVPYRLAEKMAKNDLSDPLFLQFVPLAKEKVKKKGFSKDPVGDHLVQNCHLLQKYHARALLVCTSRCSMHCRFCFRQHFAYLPEEDFSSEIEIIKNNPSIEEIILSGGDPLSFDNETLLKLLKEIEKIPHIKRIRIHSRFPIGIPERIDTGLLDLLSSVDKQFFLVIHSNHPHELDEEIFRALKKLQILNIPVLNQSVLLKGVNDSPEVLAKLYLKMIDHGVLPYYLHQLDKVQGASHFAVSIKRGKEIIKKLQVLLPGYAVPKYVCEISGEENKTPL